MKNFKRLVSIIIISVITFAVLASCGKNGGTGSDITGTGSNTTSKNITAESTIYPYTYKDATGKETVFNEAPQKAVSLSPNFTEIIYALGVEDRLAARTDYCKYPEEVKSKASIGDILEPNYESIAQIKPDVIFVSDMIYDTTVDRLKELGFNVVIMETEESFDATYELIEKLGIIFNANKNADEIISSMKQKINSIANKVKEKEKPSVYYVVYFGKDGDFTATGDTFISEVIEMAGGANIAASDKGWSYSLEKIIDKNPKYIICSAYDKHKEGLMAADGYKNLEAVKSGRIYEVDKDLFEIQGPRLADAVAILAQILHGVNIQN